MTLKLLSSIVELQCDLPEQFFFRLNFLLESMTNTLTSIIVLHGYDNNVVFILLLLYVLYVTTHQLFLRDLNA